MNIKKKHINKFQKLAQQLDFLMIEIQEYCPQANLYAEDAFNLNLMSGPTHSEDSALRPLRGNVASHAIVRGLGGGGW